MERFRMCNLDLKMFLDLNFFFLNAVLVLCSYI